MTLMPKATANFQLEKARLGLSFSLFIVQSFLYKKGREIAIVRIGSAWIPRFKEENFDKLVLHGREVQKVMYLTCSL